MNLFMIFVFIISLIVLENTETNNEISKIFYLQNLSYGQLGDGAPSGSSKVNLVSFSPIGSKIFRIIEEDQPPSFRYAHASKPFSDVSENQNISPFRLSKKSDSPISENVDLSTFSNSSSKTTGDDSDININQLYFMSMPTSNGPRPFDDAQIDAFEQEAPIEEDPVVEEIEEEAVIEAPAHAINHPLPEVEVQQVIDEMMDLYDAMDHPEFRKKEPKRKEIKVAFPDTYIERKYEDFKIDLDAELSEEEEVEEEEILHPYRNRMIERTKKYHDRYNSTGKKKNAIDLDKTKKMVSDLASRKEKAKLITKHIDDLNTPMLKFRSFLEFKHHLKQEEVFYILKGMIELQIESGDYRTEDICTLIENASDNKDVQADFFEILVDEEILEGIALTSVFYDYTHDDNHMPRNNSIQLIKKLFPSMYIEDQMCMFKAYLTQRGFGSGNTIGFFSKIIKDSFEDFKGRGNFYGRLVINGCFGENPGEDFVKKIAKTVMSQIPDEEDKLAFFKGIIQVEGITKEFANKLSNKIRNNEAENITEMITRLIRIDKFKSLKKKVKALPEDFENVYNSARFDESDDEDY